MTTDIRIIVGKDRTKKYFILYSPSMSWDDAERIEYDIWREFDVSCITQNKHMLEYGVFDISKIKKIRKFLDKHYSHKAILLLRCS